MNAAQLEATEGLNPPPAGKSDWSAGRWTLYIAIAFAVHIGLIYLLGNRQPIQPRPVKNAVSLQLALACNSYLELQDPTIFAGPHRHGFASSTWLPLPKIPYPTFRWTEPPHLLDLAAEQLGAAFLSYARTNIPVPREIALLPAPTTSILAPVSLSPVPKQSTLRVDSRLRHRPLKNPPVNLPLQRAVEGLTNSIIQVLVDASGCTFSPTLIPPGSGLKEADQLAQKIAAEAKFAPSENSDKVEVGTLIFEWQPDLQSTNSQPAPE